MNNLAFLSIQELKELLQKNKISPQELVEFYQKRAQELSHLGAVLEVFDTESIVKDAIPTGLLAGIPGYIKDNICQKNRITSCASKILQHFNSPYDATVVARLKQEGGLPLGRTNMDEFAMGSSGETSAFGKTRNPWNNDCVPGGSSSGSAAAVAAGLAPWALGSDTGGSVRQPAAMCGIVGLKPTYGLVSRYGLIAYGSSLDTIGVLTRSVYDNALVFSAMAGLDLSDSSSLSVKQKDYTIGLDGSIPENLTIGVVETAFEAEALHPEIREANLQAIRFFESKGVRVKKITLSTLDYCAASYFIISRAEAASNLARFDGIRYGDRAQSEDLNELYEQTRRQGFGAEVKARILMGNYVLSVGHAGQFYNNAQLVRRAIRKELTQAFQDVDVLVMPSHAVPAFKLGAFDNDKLAMDLQDYFTAPVNLTGVPGLSIPVGFSSDGKPLGMQLIGPNLSESLLFKLGHAFQQETDWHKKHPSL